MTGCSGSSACGGSYMAGAGVSPSTGYSGGKYSGSGYSSGKYAGASYASSNYGVGNYGGGFPVAPVNYSVKLPDLGGLYGELLANHLLPEGSMGIKELKAFVAPYKSVSDYLDGLIKASFNKASIKSPVTSFTSGDGVADLGGLLKKYEVLPEVKTKFREYERSIIARNELNLAPIKV